MAKTYLYAPSPEYYIYMSRSRHAMYTGCTYVQRKEGKITIVFGEFRVECKRNDLHKTYIILYNIPKYPLLNIYNKRTFYPAGRCVYIYIIYVVG